MQLVGNILSSQDNDGSPRLYATIVVIAMLFGATGATKLIVRARRTEEVELAYVGLFFFAHAAMAIGHALATPGVLFSHSSSLSVWFWTTPIALIAALPGMLGRSTAGRAIDQDWRQWVTTFQVAIVTFAIMLIIAPNVLPQVPTGIALWVVAIASVAGCVALSARHMFLATVAQSTGPLTVACAIVMIGTSNLVWLDMHVFATGFWLSQFTVIFGVIIGGIAALGSYQITSHVERFIQPMAAADPRCALEIGTDPALHAFVADLQASEPVRIEHVLGTRDLAMTVGAKLGSSDVDLRDIGLTALLHDIGMMFIPAVIVDSPSKLTDEEYAIVKRHPIYGARLLEKSPALKSIAPAVAAHHERIDGAGYPYGLSGPNVHPHARIVAVCDAFDALSNHRHYRRSYDFEEAIEVLERGAGLQWDRRVVEYVVRTVRYMPKKKISERTESELPVGCDCMPELEAS